MLEFKNVISTTITSGQVSWAGESLIKIKYRDINNNDLALINHLPAYVGSTIESVIVAMQAAYNKVKFAEWIDASFGTVRSNWSSALSAGVATYANYVANFDTLSNLPTGYFREYEIEGSSEITLNSTKYRRFDVHLKGRYGLASPTDVDSTKYYHYNKLTHLITRIDTDATDTEDESHFVIKIINKVINYGVIPEFKYTPRDEAHVIGGLLAVWFNGKSTYDDSDITYKMDVRTNYNSDALSWGSSSVEYNGFSFTAIGDGTFRPAYSVRDESPQQLELYITPSVNITEPEVYSRI